MIQHHKLSDSAIGVLKAAAVNGYLQASAQQTDNYANVWARDSAVSILSIAAGNIESLYQAAQQTLQLLQQANNTLGQIPSNVSPNNHGGIDKVSFGSVAGRTDANFWWLIAALTLLKKLPDAVFEEAVKQQADKLFTLADSWEFNGRHLMYVPMSSNWADEYITHGYVLYDQLLRYWALLLAAEQFSNTHWATKAKQIKTAIKQHYLFEQPLAGSLYTQAQRQTLANYSIDHQFIASFSPGDRVERFDGWSIALLLLLDVPSAESKEKLFTLLAQTFKHYKFKGVPAFWPEINEQDAAYKLLLNNHSFRFKNKPGHFHNGGIWPVVNGFIVAALNVCGNTELSATLMEALSINLEKADQQYSFAEYFDLHNGVPGGTSGLCFSAAGYILAQTSAQDIDALGCMLPVSVKRAIKVRQTYAVACQKILKMLPPINNEVLVVAIAGQSGSGKTTLSSTLKQALEKRGLKTLLLHQDDYFALPPGQNHQARLQNFDHIGYSEVRLDLLDAHIRAIKEQQSSMLNIPHMNWVTDTEEHKTLNIAHTRVVLVEGTYTSLLTEPHFRIFFDCDYKQTRDDRLNRARDEASDFIERVLQKESELISVHQPLANLVLNRNLEVVHHIFNG